MQEPLFPPKSDWKLTPVSELPSWAEAKRVGFDVETCDPHLKQLGPGSRRGGFVAGVSFQIEDGPGYYLPIRHLNGENLPEEKVWQYLRDQSEVFKGEICGLHLPYDMDFPLVQGGLWWKHATFRDVGVAEPLIDELQFSYGLDAIAKRWGREPKREDLLRIAANAYGVDPKADMWKLPAKYVGEYAVYDAELPLKLLRLQERKISDQDLWGVWDLESALLPVLVKMRARGVRIDMEKLERLEKKYMAEEQQACRFIHRQTGRSIDPEELDNAGAIAAVLRAMGITEDDVGLTDGRKGKDGAIVGRQLRTDAATLASISHPATDMLRRAKRFHKLRCTFVHSIRRHATNGRIHGTFKQIKGETDFGGDDNGAGFGRTSALNPNLQQMPNPERDPDIAGEFREVFIPDEGKLWACADFSQQEPRMAVHYAETLGLAKAARGSEPFWLAKAVEAANRYRTDPDVDNHQMIADMCGIERKPAKIILLGKMYGMGGGKLCASLGLPTEMRVSRKFGEYLGAGPEGRAIIDQFDERLPFVKALAKECEQLASVRGYIKTLSGRRCRFPLDYSGRYEHTRKALNRLIQGGSGDQMKKALVDMDAEGVPVQLVVHDEADLSVADHAEADRVAEIMMSAYPMRLPFRVDVGVGKNWGETC